MSEDKENKSCVFTRTKTLEQWERISVWDLPELLGHPPKPKPTTKECYSKYFKEFREKPVVYTVVMLLVILSFFAFMALPAFIYFGGQYAYENVGIQNWFHQILWWGHTPFALVGAFIFFFKWEYYIWSNFSPAMIGGKEEYKFLCPFFSYCSNVPTPIHQLPEWLQARLQAKKRKALETPEPQVPSSPSDNP